MQYLFLSLFFIAVVVDLADAWRGIKNRDRAKPFLLLFLTCYYVSVVIGRHQPVMITLLLALILSWIGDICLMQQGDRWFMVGGTSFLCAHIFFILTYALHISYAGMPWAVIALAAVLFLIITLFVTGRCRREAPAVMTLAALLYLLANSAMNTFALMQLFTNRNPAVYAAFAGALLFLVSDSVLFLCRYDPQWRTLSKRDFVVMLTYIAAQFLIVTGVLGIA